MGTRRTRNANCHSGRFNAVNDIPIALYSYFNEFEAGVHVPGDQALC
jgi:hypothetical protein